METIKECSGKCYNLLSDVVEWKRLNSKRHPYEGRSKAALNNCSISFLCWVYKDRQKIYLTNKNVHSSTHLTTRSNRTRRFSTRISRVLALMVLSLLSGGVDTRSDVIPCTVVQRFLLAPVELGVGVLVHMRGELRKKPISIPFTSISKGGGWTYEIVRERRDLF